jgi:hypothetical protein
MKIVHVLMRYFSYAFTAFVCVFLTGIGIVAFGSGLHNWKLTTFLFQGKDLSTAMVAFGLTGLLGVLLAFSGKFRFLHPLVALSIFLLTVYGFFYEGYRFADAEAFQGALAFAFGAFGSFACSLIEFKAKD